MIIIAPEPGETGLKNEKTEKNYLKRKGYHKTD